MTVPDPGSRAAFSGAGLLSGSKEKPRAPLTASQQLTCPEAADGALPPLPHASPAADEYPRKALLRVGLAPGLNTCGPS